MSTKKLRSVGTHDGPFHADEVTACALLVVFGLIDEDKIVRTRDPKELATCEYVCDVGGVYDPDQLLFDHHQLDYQGPLSSAGMVLRHFKATEVIDEELFELLRSHLVDGVDAHDIGRAEQTYGVCTFSHIIANFSPVAYDATMEEFHAAFFEAFAFVKGHLRRVLARHNYALGCRQVVAEAMAGDGEVLMFDRRLPWLENFFALGGESHPAKFVVMPAGDHWKLRGIPPNYADRMGVRVPMPAAWAGLLDDKLKKVSGISGAVFCHKGRFISVWETKEDALRALEEAMKHDDNL